MVVHESGENYLETILVLRERLGQVRSIDIATELGFSKPSISVAMKRLRENGYIDVDGRGYITLTEDGMEIAAKMYERHQFLSTYFQKLGVSEATAVEDACRIEHILSEETFECIRKHVENLK